MLLHTGKERERKKLKETDRAEEAGLIKVRGPEEGEWVLFKLSVKISTKTEKISCLC